MKPMEFVRSGIWMPVLLFDVREADELLKRLKRDTQIGRYARD